MDIRNATLTNLQQTFQEKLKIGNSTIGNSGQRCASTMPDSSMNSGVFRPYNSSELQPDEIDDITSQSKLQANVKNSPSKSMDVMATISTYQEKVGGTTYFYPSCSESLPVAEDCSSTSQDCSFYPVQPNNNSTPTATPVKSKSGSFFLSEELHREMLNRNLMAALPESEQYDLPQFDGYHDLCPLERLEVNCLQKTHLGYQASMYRAVNAKTGGTYCLRRIHGFRLQNSKCMLVVDLWKGLNHPNIVQLQEVFTTKAFGDTSLMFVYDFYPGAETLLNKYFPTDQSDIFFCDSSPRPYSHQKTNILRYQQHNKLPEVLIWNYIIQLTSALRLIHSSGLAYRNLDPTKIIMTAPNRLRLSCIGVMDVVANEKHSSANSLSLVQHYQQEDLMALGKLILAIACKSTKAVQRENISTALDIVGRSYSGDLRNLIMYLLSPQQRKSITDLMPMIGARFYTQMDNLNSYIEILEYELAKEVQNGRLFRLMAKLGTINERPELNMDGSWSETGDRYMLKLFRDFVFHQVTEDGRPWVDMSHIVQCLNKLDAGVLEKICLMSRDEQSMLVVTYAELKHCLEQSFHEILTVSRVKKNQMDDGQTGENCNSTASN